MKLPRDLSGAELAKLLSRYGYEISRQTGSHLRLTSSIRGTQHHIALPAHKTLRVGTLAGVLKEVCAYMKMSRSDLEREPFGN